MKPTENSKKNSSKVSSRLSLGERVPKLRFSGFKGEWNAQKLGNLCTIKTGKLDANRCSENGKYPFFTCSRETLCIDSYSFDCEAILIAGNGDIGHTKYYNGKFDAYQRTYVLSEFSDEPLFIKSLIDRHLPAKVQSEMQGGAMPYIKLSTLYELLLHIPSHPEQRKLSSFVSLLDSRISAQCKLVELLKKHKRGLLDRIFERSKETEEWKKYRLDQIAEINPSSESLPCEFFYIDLESVSDGVWHDKKVVKKESAPSRAQRVIQKNDILFQMVRPYQQNNLHITSSYDKPIVASTGYAQIRTSQNPSFIYWLLHSRTFLRKVLLRCTGSSYPAINSSDLKEIYVSIPPLEDQDQYARTLNYISQKCNIEESLVCHLENLKSGLLQQMFV